MSTAAGEDARANRSSNQFNEAIVLPKSVFGFAEGNFVGRKIRRGLAVAELT